jgi:hypothetical protein
MNPFIKSVENKKASLLYLMGATWHNSCMFDLKTTEPSFADLLNAEGIETYSFNIGGTGPDQPLREIGDQHTDNIEHALELINEYQIEYVLGYSYGALVLSELIDRLPSCVKGIILLDPYAVLKQDKVILLDNGDKKLVTRQQVSQDLVDYGCNITDAVKYAYLDKLSQPGTELITASYPGKHMKANFEKFSGPANIERLCSKKIVAFFTNTSNKLVRDRFPASATVFWPDSTHWILLEQKRFDLAKSIAEFIDSK